MAVVLVLSVDGRAGLLLEAGFIAKEEAYAGLRQAGSPETRRPRRRGGRLVAHGRSARMWGVLVSPDAWTGRSPTTRPSRRSSLPLRPSASSPWCSASFRPSPSIARRRRRAELGAEAEVDLALWHGVNLPLVLSVVTIAAGAVLFWLRREVARVLAAGERVPSSANAYFAVLRDSTSRPTATVVQNGSPPVYAGVVLLTSAVLPGAVPLTRRTGPGGPSWSTPPHLPVAAVVIGAALAAATIRRRLSAVLFLGVVGYGMAALFVVQGAPDLAHPGGDRDPVDGAVRPGAAPLRTGSSRGRRTGVAPSAWWCRPPSPSRSSASPCSPVRTNHRPGVGRDGRAVAARRARQQRRQRDPRRLPGPRHPGRDHRPRHGLDRHGGPRPGGTAGATERATASWPRSS